MHEKGGNCQIPKVAVQFEANLADGDDLHEGERRPEKGVKGVQAKGTVKSVARWQNLFPSFPWIAPGVEGGGAIQGKEGITFCSVA